MDGFTLPSELLNRQHKYYGTEDVSQAGGETPLIGPLQRKERKLVLKICHQQISLFFRKGAGPARLRNVAEKDLGVFINNLSSVCVC